MARMKARSAKLKRAWTAAAERSEGLVVSTSGRFEVDSATREDLQQQGRIALATVEQSYSKERGAYSTLARKAMVRAMAEEQRRHQPLGVWLGDYDQVDSSPSVEAQLEHKEELEQLHRCLWLIPEEQRHVLCRVYGLQGFTPEPIKHIEFGMDGRHNTGKELLAQALASLRRLMVEPSTN